MPLWGQRLIRSRPLQAILVLAVAAILADITLAAVYTRLGAHQFATAMLAEALLLGAVYLGLNAFVSARQELRWTRIAREPLKTILLWAGMTDAGVDVARANSWRFTSRQEADDARGTLRTFTAQVDQSQALLTATPFLAALPPSTVEFERCADLLLGEAWVRTNVPDRPHMRDYYVQKYGSPDVSVGRVTV
jgi:hypothetical protein